MAKTVDDQRGLRNVKMLIGLAITSLLVAIAAGVVLLIASPASGSTAESVLGITAAVAGLAVAAFTIAAAIYAQVKNLWHYAPMWVRVVTWVIIAFAIASTVWNLTTSVF